MQGKSDVIDLLNEQLDQEEQLALVGESPYNRLFDGTGYFIRDNHFYRKYRKGDADLEQYLANYFIIAEAETVRDNGVDCDRMFQLRAVCEGKELSSAEIPAKEYSSMNFISPTWGLALRQSVGQNTLAYIRDSISAQAKNVRQEYIYTHTGWRKIKGKWAFLHAGGAIGAEGVRVELDGRLSRYELSYQEDPKKALQASLEVFKVAPMETIIPLMGLVFLSPLNEFLRQSGIEPSFVLYLLGSTGAMKSTLAALVLSFFGQFDNKCLPESFKDTANSLEKQGFLLKDVLTVVDDYHPTRSVQEARKMQATAQAVARMYGDRTGRGRMNADATLRQSYIPRGNAIITGEDLPDIGQSGIARNIIINVEKDSLNKSVLTALQNNAELLSGSMSAYIKWLIPQAEDLPTRLKAQFLDLRNAATADNRHGRTSEATAHLQMGITSYLQFLTDCGVLSKGEADQKIQESWNILLDLADNQSKQLDQEKPTTLFLNAFHELLEVGEIYILNTEQKTTDGYTPVKGFVGYEDENYYYLKADTIFSYVVQFYKTQDRHFPIQKKSLLKQLVAEGLAEPNQERNRNVKQKKINGKKANYLWLYNQKETS